MQERVREPKPSFSSQLQGCSSPCLCPGPFSWRSPLLQRVAHLDSFEGQSPFCKPVRNTSISATITFYWCKNIRFTEQLHKNVKQRYWTTPYSRGELESIAGTFGDGERLRFSVWGHVCCTSKCTVCMCWHSPALQAKLAGTAQGLTFPQPRQTV